MEEEKEELGDAIKLFNRGLESHMEGKLDRALEQFKKALPTFQEFGVEDMIAGTFHEIGMILQEQGKYDDALDYYQRSLQLSESIKYRAGCAKTLFQIGTLYEEKGDIITANDYYHRSKVYSTSKPGPLNFIIFVFIALGVWGLGMGIAGISGALQNWTPTFVNPAQWAYVVSFANTFGGFLLFLGIISLIAGIGLIQLKGWGWVAGIITSLMTLITIFGIISYWYLSKENIQELYDVK
ncbi:MAG: tetratricopeptide repeat protein [Candidatus Helarchaeota archaeon]